MVRIWPTSHLIQSLENEENVENIFSFLTSSICYALQTFEGNTNYDTPELRTFEPVSTRFIRVYPERATHGGLGLRMELLGCELEGNCSARDECTLLFSHIHSVLGLLLNTAVPVQAARWTLASVTAISAVSWTNQFLLCRHLNMPKAQILFFLPFLC